MTASNRRGPSQPCPGCFRPKGDLEKCPHCGYDTSAERSPGLLRWWTLLNGRYLIGREYKHGGRRRYLAWDRAAGEPVVISEHDAKKAVEGIYAELAYETALRMDWNSEYAAFIQGDLKRMGKLARLRNRHLERVRDAFSANVKVYAVMDWMPGMSLGDYLAHAGGTLPENRAIAVTLPILDALRELHAAGLHGFFVSENTIFLADGTRPVLLFCPVDDERHPMWDVRECAKLLNRMMGGYSTSIEIIAPPGMSPGLAALLKHPPEDPAAFQRALLAVRDGVYRKR